MGLAQYLEDYWSGNVGLWRIALGFLYAAYYTLYQKGTVRLPALLEWVYDTFHILWRGTLFPRNRE